MEKVGKFLLARAWEPCLVHYPKKPQTQHLRWSIKVSAHHIQNQTEIATEEFRLKTLLQKLK